MSCVGGQELGAYLVLDKPNDPEEYLIKKLKEVQEAKKKKTAVGTCCALCVAGRRRW